MKKPKAKKTDIIPVICDSCHIEYFSLRHLVESGDSFCPICNPPCSHRFARVFVDMGENEVVLDCWLECVNCGERLPYDVMFTIEISPDGRERKLSFYTTGIQNDNR